MRFARVLILICGLTKAQQDIYCGNGTIYNDVYYEKILLFNSLGKPYNLLYHRDSQLLFFSHTVNDTEYGIDFKIMACRLDFKKCKTLEVPGGFAIAYDYDNNKDVYFGGNDGIYKYDFETHTARMHIQEHISMWSLFKRHDRFYCIRYPKQRLYVYSYLKHRFDKAFDLRDQVMDTYLTLKNGDIYFSNKTGLYIINKHTLDDKVTLMSDALLVRQISTDSHGRVYFCAQDGVYTEDLGIWQKGAINLLMDTSDATGLAFDENNVPIFADGSNIYRLAISPDADACYKVLRPILINNEK